MKTGRLHSILAFAAVFLSSACAFYPKKSEDFDGPTCAVYRNPLTLDVAPAEINCDHSDVRSCLIAYSMMGPATFAASGTLVAAGNGLYWLGNRSDCSIQAYARQHTRRHQEMTAVEPPYKSTH
ncbi:MAG TPA: hypothetical protein VN915_09065 [Elusimicrobiota bacterium]|nr:hypothetical protein [Elusimicrobiota bacterium]